jgi:hypothetical protein
MLHFCSFPKLVCQVPTNLPVKDMFYLEVSVPLLLWIECNILQSTAWCKNKRDGEVPEIILVSWHRGHGSAYWSTVCKESLTCAYCIWPMLSPHQFSLLIDCMQREFNLCILYMAYVKPSSLFLGPSSLVKRCCLTYGLPPYRKLMMLWTWLLSKFKTATTNLISYLDWKLKIEYNLIISWFLIRVIQDNLVAKLTSRRPIGIQNVVYYLWHWDSNI